MYQQDSINRWNPISSIKWWFKWSIRRIPKNRGTNRMIGWQVVVVTLERKKSFFRWIYVPMMVSNGASRFLYWWTKRDINHIWKTNCAKNHLATLPSWFRVMDLMENDSSIRYISEIYKKRCWKWLFRWRRGNSQIFSEFPHHLCMNAYFHERGELVLLITLCHSKR